MFAISDVMMDRPIYAAGNTMWRITAAIGFAKGKRIFCFPWQTNRFVVAGVQFSLELIADIARKEGCILLIPVENDEQVKHFVDDIIDLSYKTRMEKIQRGEEENIITTQ